MTRTRLLPAICTAMALSASALPLGAGTSDEAAALASTPGTRGAPAETLVAATASPELRLFLGEVLERNPDIAALAASARAAAERAPQVRALPDPAAALTAYLLTPETRVGPQRAMLSLSQRFPWFGKLRRREQVAVYEAAASLARVEAARLRVVTETRRLAYELAFQDAYAGIVREDRSTLGHYEELARARYASGVGLEQAVVKLQAEITRDDARLLEIATRRVSLVAQLNAMRDRPEGTPIPSFAIPRYPSLSLSLPALRQQAMNGRPEITEADARIAAARTAVELANQEYDPDVTLGLTYTLVGTRGDAAGRAMPPPDNGRDILGVTGGVNLPVWRAKLAAGVAEATSRQLAAEQGKRAVVTGIDQALDDLVDRLPLTVQRLELFQGVLAVQARQSLASAEAGYASGTQNALDLLDAERVLLDVRTATERALADVAIAVAQLEGTVAAPLAAGPEGEQR